MAQTQAELYKDSTVTANDLASNSVTTTKIASGAVTSDKLDSSIKLPPFTTRGFNLPL